MNEIEHYFAHAQTRRQFFGRAATGIGAVALASLLDRDLVAAVTQSGIPKNATHGVLKALHHAPKAKRVIYLHQSGAPSHIDLFDYKPKMQDYNGQELPASIRMGQRITGMTAGQAKFPVAASKFKFTQSGKNGIWLSELLPHTAKVVDDICFIRSMHTEAINHDPAITFIQTGSEQPGRPSIGAWLSYGIGSENQDLPAFIVLISQGTGELNDQPLFSRLWGTGFLPPSHQGVKFRSQGDPVLYLKNPPGFDRAARREMLDALDEINRAAAQEIGDPEIDTRIQQYEMAYRMQASVPELMDVSSEPASTFELYGEEARKPGTFAANALLARRLTERGVRFVQLYHRGWDQHGSLNANLPKQCKDVDQASAALVADLKQRGLLDETLVIWGGEFGRTVYVQGNIDNPNYGRDHHPRCFTVWLAGGGVKSGIVFGETDDYCYNIVEAPVHVHDLNATILHLLGIDHERFTFKFQGRDYRLTDVHGKVVKGILATA
ncbi:MAG TPA: DUF1501 domain-containing protein [Chthoniobacteraceae bacterium]|jgi:hypothetical protein|nr:DUF1501 domain-containing protein [Chthoniobacteraceae bacterium]